MHAYVTLTNGDQSDGQELHVDCLCSAYALQSAAGLVRHMPAFDGWGIYTTYLRTPVL